MRKRGHIDREQGIFLLDIETGETRSFLDPDILEARYHPIALPDGRILAVSENASAPGEFAVYDFSDLSTSTIELPRHKQLAVVKSSDSGRVVVAAAYPTSSYGGLAQISLFQIYGPPR